MWLSDSPEPGATPWCLSVIGCLRCVSLHDQPFAVLESWQQSCVILSPALSLLSMSSWFTKWPWKCLRLLTSILGNYDLRAAKGTGLSNEVHCLKGPDDMKKLAVSTECRVRHWARRLIGWLPPPCSLWCIFLLDFCRSNSLSSLQDPPVLLVLKVHSKYSS